MEPGETAPAGAGYGPAGWLLLRRIVVAGVLATGSAAFLSGCAADPAPPAPALPLTIGGGQGSQFGTYESLPAGEILRDGVSCLLFVWDRPLTATTALRIRSASCPVPGQPLMAAREVDRAIIPLADSPALTQAGADGAGMPGSR